MTEKKTDLRVGATHLQQEPPPPPAVESAGVETLIARLRDQGIAQGKSQAQEIVREAEKQAADVVAAAKREADAMRVKANEEAGKVKAAGEDAIRLAMRDTMLSLEGDLLNRFRNMLGRLVREVLQDPTFLQRVILEVAGKAAPAAKPVELLLPSELVSMEELQRKPEEATPGTLTHFVLSMGGDMLREGVSFGVADDKQAGIRVKLVGEDMQIDLTESAISQLLLRHMLPRFRAVLRGAVVVKRPLEEAAEERPAGEHEHAAPPR
jgi:V/A-type H+-transporting ATPase subunit E